MDTQLITRSYASPAGELLLGWRDASLCLCDWVNCADLARHIRRAESHPLCRDGACPVSAENAPSGSETGQAPSLPEAKRQLEEYFAGRRTSFSLPLLLVGTPFHRQVWQALREIPYGETRTYHQIANQIGRPTAVRAVANAVADNPISIIIPCHRVVGSDGSLTGYAGGLEAKRTLLEIEGATQLRY